MFEFFGKKGRPKKEVSSKGQFYKNSPKKEVSSKCQCQYTSKIFYIPLFFSIVIFFIINIIGISIYATDKREYKDKLSRRLSIKRNLDCNCCCCCNCQNNTNCNCNNNPNNQDQTQNEENSGQSNDNQNENNPSNPDNNNENNNNDSNGNDDNQNNNNKDNNNNSNNNNQNNNEKDDSEKKNIKRLKDCELGLSLSLFFFSIIFFFTLVCFISKNCLIAGGSFFCLQFCCSIFPLIIYFSIDLALIVIRINCNNSYKLLFGIDDFFKLNLSLIWLNFIEMFFIVLIIIFLIMIFFCSFNSICLFCNELISFFCCCFYCNCNECKYEIKKFYSSIFEKEKKNNNNDNKTNDIIINNTDDIKNTLYPPLNSEETRLKGKLHNNNLDDKKTISSIEEIKNKELPPPNNENDDYNQNDDINIDNINYKGNIILHHLDFEEKGKKKFLNNYLDDKSSNSHKMLYNPIGKNAEIYKQNILQGQKILIVMTYHDNTCNIQNLYNNGNNKTVKEAVEYFGITIVSKDNYNDAIKELKKNENGKCPYYACWLMNDRKESEKMEEFLQILYKFWKKGGAVVLFSDNEPYILETNQFLSMINAGFTMEGSYQGEKYIYGDDTGKLDKVGVFNRNENTYKYENIQRQKLSHNLYKIYEGITISSVTKNGKRCLDVKSNDIYPFVIFARDSEGGITSLFKPANKEEGDLIIDGGFTKLFINMEEDGTFRYVQNLAGFTARPEVHMSFYINPKDYRPDCVE